MNSDPCLYPYINVPTGII